MRAIFLLGLLLVFSGGAGLLGTFLIFLLATGNFDSGTAIIMFIVTLLITSLLLGLTFSERQKLWPDGRDPIKWVAFIGLVAGVAFAGLFILLTAAIKGPGP